MEKTTAKKQPAVGWSLGFAWLSTLLLFVLAALVVLATTLCNSGFMQAQVRKSSFSDAAYSLLKDNFESYAAATGFDGAVLTSELSPAQIQADMEAAVAKLYAGDTAFDRRQDLAVTAYNAMQADLEGRGVEMTETVESGIAIVADACRNDYAGYVSVPMASQLYTAIAKIKSVLWLGIVLAALFSAAALLLTMRLAPNARMGVRCLSFVFLAATALCLLVAFALYPALHLGNFRLEPTSLRLLLLSYVRGIFGRFGVFSAAYGALAAALLALTGMAHSKARQRIRNTQAK